MCVRERESSGAVAGGWGGGGESSGAAERGRGGRGGGGRAGVPDGTHTPPERLLH